MADPLSSTAAVALPVHPSIAAARESRLSHTAAEMARLEQRVQSQARQAAERDAAAGAVES